MPQFDRTGPNGDGPMTGRGLGRCNCPRFGYRRFFSKSNELDSLKEEESFLEKELKNLKEEINKHKDQK